MDDDTRPTFGSLFSGIGGIDLGLERAGWRPVWQCDSDPYCRRVLAKHWPTVPCYDDVHSIHRAIPRVDLIAGGFPCQPVSNAGQRKAQADARWLWPEFARIIGTLRPRYVLVENVPGLLSRGFGDVLGDLAALGFDAEWGMRAARDVGAPHLRKRVFVLAYSHEVRCGEGLGKRTASWVTGCGDAIGCGERTADVADTDDERRDRRTGQQRPTGGTESTYGSSTEAPHQWTTEPDVGRVAHGIPARVDRLRGLGNAVVPQVAEWIGHRLMQYHKSTVTL